MNPALTGFLFALGATAAIAIAAAALWLLASLWTRLRYTRPGWWLHRHWPTPRRRS